MECISITRQIKRHCLQNAAYLFFADALVDTNNTLALEIEQDAPCICPLMQVKESMNITPSVSISHAGTTSEAVQSSAAQLMGSEVQRLHREFTLPPPFVTAVLTSETLRFTLSVKHSITNAVPFIPYASYTTCGRRA